METTRDSDPHAQMPPRLLRFDHYVLDLDRGCLLDGRSEITLRPKTFAILAYLVQNPGRLVSKDALFAAVWPNIAVTDDALVQSIGELRRAFGSDGQRLIKTVPRRGYRFEADVSAAASDEGAAAGTPLPTSGDDSEPLAKPAASPTVRGRFVSAAANVRIAALVGLALLALAAVLVIAGEGWIFPHAQTATESAALGVKPAVAVLPLANQSGDPGRDYFADGLTQDIINALGRFSELTVMSWNAVLPYKDRPATPEEIGRRLAVRYLVEGSVLQVGDRVRVSAQVVERQGPGTLGLRLRRRAGGRVRAAGGHHHPSRRRPG